MTCGLYSTPNTYLHCHHLRSPSILRSRFTSFDLRSNLTFPQRGTMLLRFKGYIPFAASSCGSSNSVSKVEGLLRSSISPKTGPSVSHLSSDISSKNESHVVLLISIQSPYLSESC